VNLQAEAYKLSPSTWTEDLGLLRDSKGRPVSLDRWQRQILDSTAKQIIVNCHRQWGKSSIASLLCLHRALFHPGSLNLIVAPSLRQSGENFRRVLAFMDRLEEQPELIEDTKLTLTMANRSRIISLPGGNEGDTIRGYSGPDLIIEDEASRCSDALYEALRPMLISNPDSRLILASTPWGQRGHFHKIWVEEADWLKVSVPATENPRLSPEDLERERVRGDFYFRQEFLCEFVGTESQLFTYDQIRGLITDEIEPLEL
jgi:hypothetical protein